ncbi:MAG: ferritin-like domain-containing protein [Solirubrobacterales bacterium]
MSDQMANPALAEVEVEDINRSAFIAKGALAVGAVYGLTMVGPFVRRAFAQGGMGDIDILNFALTLEYLEAAFYEQAKMEAQLNSEASELVDLLAKDENAHVEALSSTISDLGGTPTEAPGVDFGNAFANQGSFLELAQTFEDTGVSAYNGAGPALKSKDLLATAGGIVQVEARHAAAVRLLNGQPPAPVAFDETLDMQQVLKAVDPFVV